MSVYSCPEPGPDDCQSITSPPRFCRMNPPINLTSVTSRPLHAVLLPPGTDGGRFLEALAAALDGSGPAILPLDPSLPRARLEELIAAFAPAKVETAQDFRRPAGAGRRRQAHPGRSAPQGPATPGGADTVAGAPAPPASK